MNDRLLSAAPRPPEDSASARDLTRPLLTKRTDGLDHVRFNPQSDVAAPVHRPALDIDVGGSGAFAAPSRHGAWCAADDAAGFVLGMEL